MSHGAQALVSIRRNTPDLERATAFYRDALGFHVDGTSAEGVRLRLGTQHIDLRKSANAAPYPLRSSSADLWFQHCAIAVSNMGAAYRQVCACGAKPITRGGPQTLPPATGSVTAFKFRDPDGHPLELIHFPPGTGDPCWQSTQLAGPTLGMDHTAISVSNAEHSIAFYTLLGLRVTARRVDQSPEQERLDGLGATNVEVITMQPVGARTPHLELLSYRTPRGRALTACGAPDTAADCVVLKVQGLEALTEALRSNATPISNSRPTDGPRATLASGPDGHRVLLTG